MVERLRNSWLSRLLYYCTLLAAAALGLLVLVAPLWPVVEGSRDVLTVFALDGTVRRTALASAVGLAVTSFVFFRPGSLSSKKSKLRRPPPNNLAGA